MDTRDRIDWLIEREELLTKFNKKDDGGNEFLEIQVQDLEEAVLFLLEQSAAIAEAGADAAREKEKALEDSECGENE